MFRSLHDARLPLRLCVTDAKCTVYCAHASVARETAANPACTAADLLIVAGTPIGEPEKVSQYIADSVASTVASIDILGLPLSSWEHYLLLHGSL
jgi:hypothetical protein